MEFTKILKPKPGRTASDGTCLIRNGQFLIKIKTDRPTLKIKSVGIVEDGIGVELTEGNKSLKNCVAIRVFSKEDLPVNLQATGYSFSIPAEKLSETEYVFHFKNASMVTRKKNSSKPSSK